MDDWLRLRFVKPAYLAGSSWPVVLTSGPLVEVAALGLTPRLQDDFQSGRSPAEGGWKAAEDRTGEWRADRGLLSQVNPGSGRIWLLNGDPLPSVEASCEVLLQGARRAGPLLAEETGAQTLEASVGRAFGGAALQVGSSGGSPALEPVPLPWVAFDEPVALHAEIRAEDLAVWVNGLLAYRGIVTRADRRMGLFTLDGPASFTEAAMTWLPDES